MSFLQTSGLAIIDVHTCILNCDDYLQKLTSHNDDTILPQLFKNATKFLYSIGDRLKSNETKQLISTGGVSPNNNLPLSSKIASFKEEIAKKKTFSKIDTLAKSLLHNLNERFLNEFKENEVFYKELSLLSPSNILKFDRNVNINFKYLCILFGFDQKIVEPEFVDFMSNFQIYFNSQKEANIVSLLEHVNISEIERGDEEEDEDDEFEEDELEEQTHVRVDWKLLVGFLSLANDKKIFQNVCKLYQRVLSLPCTQTKNERDFSILKNTKTQNRSSINDENLQSQMIIRLSADLLSEDEFPNIIDRIAKSSPNYSKKLMY